MSTPGLPSCGTAAARLLGGLVSMARGIGTVLGICLMALALHVGDAWHLGSRAGGGHGYAESAQARPAFVVLAVVCAIAAAIALASRGGGLAGRTSQGGGPVRCTSPRET